MLQSIRQRKLSQEQDTYLGLRTTDMRFPEEVRLQVRSLNAKRCSHHPPVGEAWRKDQKVIRSKAIVSNEVFLGCEEPNPGVLNKSFALHTTLAS